jgi:hypothetical protein
MCIRTVCVCFAGTILNTHLHFLLAPLPMLQLRKPLCLGCPPPLSCLAHISCCFLLLGQNDCKRLCSPCFTYTRQCAHNECRINTGLPSDV